MVNIKNGSDKVTVKFDAETALRFEQLLRNGLVESTAVDREDNLELRLEASRVVEIDAEAVARISEQLREALFSSGSISGEAKNALDALTKRVRSE